MNKFLGLILVIVFSCCEPILSQVPVDSMNSDQKVLVKMLNGDEYLGELIHRDDQFVVIKIINGEVKLYSNQVVSIDPYVYKGKFGYDNPHATRYYFSPSGIPIRKDNGYYQNLLVTTNFVNYGITSNISIGGGIEFISTVLGEPIWFLTPKVGFNITEKIHTGVGVLTANIPEEGLATLAYGVFTVGSTETNATIGGGYGFFDGEVTKYPVLNFAGTHRFKHNMALLSENYIITTEDKEVIYLGVFGLRVMSKKNAFDFGIVLSTEFSSEVPALPFAGYARTF